MRRTFPSDGAVEKIVVLIELYDVIVGGGVRHHLLPWITFPQSVELRFKFSVHATYLLSKRNRLDFPASRSSENNKAAIKDVKELREIGRPCDARPVRNCSSSGVERPT